MSNVRHLGLFVKKRKAPGLPGARSRRCELLDGELLLGAGGGAEQVAIRAAEAILRVVRTGHGRGGHQMAEAEFAFLQGSLL